MNTTIEYPNGDIYIGEVDEQTQPHGRGIMKYKQQPYGKWFDAQVSYKEYKGEWAHGVKSGRGEMRYYQNGHGSMKYSGEWKNDLPNGKGKFTNFGGVTDETYIGDFKDGLRHGFGIFEKSWDKGTYPPKKYEGEWKDDVRCGKGICYYGRYEENVYEGEWLNDMRDGHGVWRYENGDAVECEWKCGSKNGSGTYTFANGNSFQAEWKDDKLLMNTVKKSETSVPILLIYVYRSGFDYNKRATCLMEAKVGEYILEDKTIVPLKNNSKEKPLITITSVDNERVSYVVSSEFVEGNFPVSDSITSGEKKEYSYCKECTATIYDEDYDYTIEREIMIECG